MLRRCRKQFEHPIVVNRQHKSTLLKQETNCFTNFSMSVFSALQQNKTSVASLLNKCLRWKLIFFRVFHFIYVSLTFWIWSENEKKWSDILAASSYRNDFFGQKTKKMSKKLNDFIFCQSIESHNRGECFRIFFVHSSTFYLCGLCIILSFFFVGDAKLLLLLTFVDIVIAHTWNSWIQITLCSI